MSPKYLVKYFIIIIWFFYYYCRFSLHVDRKKSSWEILKPSLSSNIFHLPSLHPAFLITIETMSTSLLWHTHTHTHTSIHACIYTEIERDLYEYALVEWKVLVGLSWSQSAIHALKHSVLNSGSRQVISHLNVHKWFTASPPMAAITTKTNTTIAKLNFFSICLLKFFFFFFFVFMYIKGKLSIYKDEMTTSLSCFGWATCKQCKFFICQAIINTWSVEIWLWTLENLCPYLPLTKRQFLS